MIKSPETYDVRVYDLYGLRSEPLGCCTNMESPTISKNDEQVFSKPLHVIWTFHYLYL